MVRTSGIQIFRVNRVGVANTEIILKCKQNLLLFVDVVDLCVRGLIIQWLEIKDRNI